MTMSFVYEYNGEQPFVLLAWNGKRFVAKGEKFLLAGENEVLLSEPGKAEKSKYRLSGEYLSEFLGKSKVVKK